MRVWFVTTGSPRGSLRRPFVAITVLAAAGLLAAGCDSGTSGSKGSGSVRTSPANGGRPAVATVMTASTKLGPILVDGSGRTLYLFEKDRPNQSACSGACVADWPVDHSNGAPQAGSGVQAALLGTIKRGDNTTQVTYSGHPLYYYSDDTAAGQLHGQNVYAFGARWYAVTPAGRKVEGPRS